MSSGFSDNILLDDGLVFWTDLLHLYKKCVSQYYKTVPNLVLIKSKCHKFSSRLLSIAHFYGARGFFFFVEHIELGMHVTFEVN